MGGKPSSGGNVEKEGWGKFKQKKKKKKKYPSSILLRSGFTPWPWSQSKRCSAGSVGLLSRAGGDTVAKGGRGLHQI